MKRIAFLAILIAAIAISVQALPVTIDTVEIDDVLLQPSSTTRLDIERGQNINVRVKITAQANLPNVELLGFLSGYEFNDIPNERISDVTQLFDLQSNVSYVRTLQIPLPSDAQVDDYKLRIIVSDRFGESTNANFNFKIDAERHSLKIEDVLLIPGARIRSGSALLARVRIENKGQRDENDVKVVVSLPALGVSATDYIDEIQNSDRQDETEEMFLRLPRCAEPGIYKLNVDVFFNDNRRKESTTRDVQIIEDSTCAQPTTPTSTTGQGTIVAATQLVNLVQGESTIVPFSITNPGRTQQPYTISFQAPQGLNIKVSPTSSIIVAPGKTETLYVSLEAKDITGTQVVTAIVTSGTETLQTTNITVNITPKTSMTKILQGVLIALVGLLVLIGIVIALRRTGSDRTQPYY
ncbi:hypothetical protein HY486_04595 [Candidatus Woesearchaeota archaeon]|nr:hypothetical protein [Candidatus Woesearchaeota archaeon]